MTMLFEKSLGRVVQIQMPAETCRISAFSMTPEVTFTTQNAIVTKVGLSQNANVQLAQSLGKRVNVFVFGDKIGSIGVSGLAFGCACDPSSTSLIDILRSGYAGAVGAVGGVDAGNLVNEFLGGRNQPSATPHGIGQLLKFFNTNKASTRATPISMTIGDVALSGLLLGFTAEIVDPVSSVAQWGMNISTLPEA